MCQWVQRMYVLMLTREVIFVKMFIPLDRALEFTRIACFAVFSIGPRKGDVVAPHAPAPNFSYYPVSRAFRIFQVNSKALGLSMASLTYIYIKHYNLDGER